MYEVVKIVKGYEIVRLKGSNGDFKKKIPTS